MSWEPQWTLPPEPKGTDEQAVEDFYYGETWVRSGVTWRELEEWQRESWRREFRGAQAAKQPSTASEGGSVG